MFGLNGNATHGLHLSMPTLDASGSFPMPDANVGNPGSVLPPRSPTHARPNVPVGVLGVLNAQSNPFQQTHAHPYQMQQLQMQAQLQQPRQNSQQIPPQLQLQQQQTQPQVQQVPQQQLLTTTMHVPHPNAGQGFAYQLPAQTSLQQGSPLPIQLQQQRQQLQQQQQHQQIPSPMHPHQHQHQLQQVQHQQHQLQLQLQQQQQHMIHQQQQQVQQQQHILQPHLIRQQSWPAVTPLSQSNNMGHAERDFKALLRLLEFGQNLNSQEFSQPLEVWQLFVDRFYSTVGRQKLSLVNPWTKDIKIFELSASSLAKCYYINSQSGVKNTKMALDSTVEQTSKNPLTLECTKTTFISEYTNGTKVITTGTIKVVFSLDYKIDDMDFAAVGFVEYIPRPMVDLQTDLSLELKPDMKKKSSSKRTLHPKPAQPIPESVVNEFGITSKAMKAFETLDVKSKADEAIPTNTNGARDISALPRAKEASALQHNPHITSGVAQLTQNPTADHVGAFSDDGDNMQSNMVPSLDSTKRRFSEGFSQGALGMTFSASSRSPVLESNNTVNGAALSSYGITVSAPNFHQIQTTALHQSPSAIGSPLLSPSTKSTVPISTISVAAAKGLKRARNSSVASTAILSQAKLTAVGNASSSGGSRSRKGQGKKELASKRKGSFKEEPSIPASTPGSAAAAATASLSGSADLVGSPVATEKTASMSRNSTAAIGSPVSIPSPSMNPMVAAVSMNDSLGDLNSLPGSSGHLSTTNDSLDFDSATPNYYAGLNPRQSFTGNMATSGLSTYSQEANGSSGSTGHVEDSGGWTSSLEFISDPKTLDMMGEFIFEGGFDGQDVGTEVMTSDDMNNAPIASASSDVKTD